MRGDQLGLFQAADRIDNDTAVIGIKRGTRFVHQYHIRLHGEDRGNCCHTFLSAGDAVVMTVFQLLKSQLPERLVYPLFRFLTAEAVVQRCKYHVFIDCWHEHLVVGILEHKSDPAPHIGKIRPADFDAVSKDPTFTAEQTKRQFHNGGFAGAVGTDQSDALPGSYAEGEIFQNAPFLLIGKTDMLEFYHISHLTTSLPRSSAALTNRSSRNTAEEPAVYSASQSPKRRPGA